MRGGRRVSVIERFHKYVPVGLLPDECWPWLGSKDAHGYGQLNALRERGKMIKAHRMQWEDTLGPIPTGKEVCHRCDNPSCINPGHLFLAAHAENMSDMKEKGRRKGRAAGEANGRSKLTTALVAAIRQRDGSNAEVAADFGISTRHVFRIRHRLAWTGVE